MNRAECGNEGKRLAAERHNKAYQAAKDAPPPMRRARGSRAATLGIVAATMAIAYRGEQI